MRELTLAEVSKVAVILKQCVPDLLEVYIFGSAAVAALHPELAGYLRSSVDVDMAPKDKPVFTSDSRFVEDRAGQDSDFYDSEGFFLDYIPAELLRVTPPGWQQRTISHEIAPGLTGHFLDVSDVAYNKLWVGRTKDVTYIRELLAAGVLTARELLELHASNESIAPEDREKVESSLKKLGVF